MGTGGDESRRMPLPARPWMRLPSGRKVLARYVVRGGAEVWCGVTVASFANPVRELDVGGHVVLESSAGAVSCESSDPDADTTDDDGCLEPLLA